MTYLEQKVRIIAFLEMIFQLDKDDRSISFSKIAQVCQIEQTDVELLVMKAMSLNLIQGTIDEVQQLVHVDWVQPRYLQKSHLQILATKMDNWEQKLDQVIRMVENNSVDLIKGC